LFSPCSLIGCCFVSAGCALFAAPALAAATTGGDAPAIGVPPGLVLIGILLVASVASLGVLRRQGILARDAFTPPTRRPEPVGVGFWAAGAALMYFAIPIGAQIALAASGELESARAGEQSLRAMAIALAGSASAGVLIAIGLLRVIQPRFPDLGFGLKVSDLSWGFAILLVALPAILLTSSVSGVVAHWISGEAPDPLAHETLRLLTENRGGGWWWLTIGGVVVLAPILEELLYRGFVQSALVALTGSRWLAIIVGSLIFTSVHIGAADWRAMPGLFVLSMAMGIAFERKGRIGIPIVMHALYNAFNVLISMG